MEDPFKEYCKSKTAKEWIIEHQIGLLGTIIFHLIILIAILVVKLSPVAKEGNTVYLEFMEPEVKENKQEQINRLVEEILKNSDTKAPSISSHKASDVRNVSVNSDLDKLTDKLVDNKYGKSNSVYEEARQLAERMKANEQLYKKAQDASKMPTAKADGGQSNSRSSSDQAYGGASVLAYSLSGRQGTYLPVPAYLCEGGGDIVVDIIVNQKGSVTSASISAKTTGSECLFAEALKAARRSRFTMNSSAPASQHGSITYRFVAQ